MGISDAHIPGMKYHLIYIIILAWVHLTQLFRPVFLSIIVFSFFLSFMNFSEYYIDDFSKNDVFMCSCMFYLKAVCLFAVLVQSWDADQKYCNLMLQM